MTTEVEARDTLVGAVEQVWNSSEFKDIPLYTDSGPQPQVDHDTVFCRFYVKMLLTRQKEVGQNPQTRTEGYLIFDFGSKEGHGVRRLQVMRQAMTEAFKAVSLGEAGKWVHLLIPTPRREPTLPGWNFVSLQVPFYFDQA